MLAVMNTSESSGGPGIPTFTLELHEPNRVRRGAVGVGLPTVTDLEVATGGLQDGNARGGPCCGSAHHMR